MQKILVILMLLMSSACAHQTIHEACSDDLSIVKYQYMFYEQCYYEEGLKRAEPDEFFERYMSGVVSTKLRQISSSAATEGPMCTSVVSEDGSINVYCR